MPATNTETLTSKITNVADAIRTKTNTSDKMTLDDMPAKITAIQTGSSEDAFTMDDLVAWHNRPDTQLPESAKKITELLPTMKEVPSYFFSSVDGLRGASIELTETTEVDPHGFSYCKVRDVSIPKVTYIDSFTFEYCGYLYEGTINLPEVTTANINAFQYAQVESINVPKLTAVPTKGFSDCEYLKELNLPSVTSLGKSCFYNCQNMTKVDIGGDIATIGGSSAYEAPFESCKKCVTLILRSSKVPKLVSVNGLTYNNYYNSGAGFSKNGPGHIYVPKSLIEEYKTATNWSVLADNFRAIEDYPDICGDSNTAGSDA